MPAPLIDAILPNNDEHRRWALRELRGRLGDLDGRRITVLGLAYTAGTSATRRSVGIEMCRELLAAGASVMAFDPLVSALPPVFAAVELSHIMEDACARAEAVVVATEWPEFRRLTADSFTHGNGPPTVIDQPGWLASMLGADSRVHYVRFGV